MEGLSTSELLALLEIISDCTQCATIGRFLEIAAAVGDMLQAGNIVFLSSKFDFSSTPASIHEINVSYPVQWVDMYRAANYVKVDPILTPGLTGLLYWDDIYKEHPPDREFYSQATAFGLSNGFSHILADKHAFSLMSVADKGLRNSTRSRVILNALAPHLHQLAARLHHRNLYQINTPLTPREREVLLWVMEGKTNWEISVILGVGQESIKGHVAHILRKLEASNRAHAVAIALQNGLLSPCGLPGRFY